MELKTLVLVVAVALASAYVATIVPMDAVSVTAEDAVTGTPTVEPTPVPTTRAKTYEPPTPTPTPTAAPPSSDLDRVEQRTRNRVIELVNGERSERGRVELFRDGGLVEDASRHSYAMSRDHELRHSAGPVSCDASWSENVAKTWYRAHIVGGNYYHKAEGLANGLVEQWMGSPEHRENMLRDDWAYTGVGVKIVKEDGKYAVYATQQFCS